MDVARRTARWLPGLLGIAALLLVGWLLRADADPGPDVAPEVVDAVEGDAPALREGVAGSPPPGLIGRGDGRPEPEAPRAPEVPTGAVQVRCLAPDGSPLGGAHVDVVPGPPVGSPFSPDAPKLPTYAAVADAAGVASFEAVPVDGSYVARLKDPSSATGRAEGAFLLLAGDGDSGPVRLEGRLLTEAGVPVVHAAWGPGDTGLVGPPQAEVLGPEVVLQQAEGLPLEVRHVAALHARLPGGLPSVLSPSFAGLPSGDPPRAPLWSRLRPGASHRITVTVPPVPGEVPGSVTDLGLVAVSPAARRLVAEVPVWPEADVRVFVPAAAAAGGREVGVSATLEGRPLPGVGAAWVGEGVLAVSGVPHRRGARLEIGLLAVDGQPGRTASGRLPASFGERLDLEAVVPASPTAAHPGGRWILGGTSFRVATDLPLLRATQVTIHIADGPRVGWIDPEASAEPPATATLTVLVEPAPGHRAGDAVVRLGDRSAAADARGVAVFDGLAPGSHTVRIDGAGPAVSVADVTVEPGSRTDLRVAVPPPAQLDVRVVDPLGREVPFARIGVTQPSGLPWSDLVGREQRIDPFVDERGRRTLHNLEGGRIVVGATQGERTGTAEVELEPGGRAAVRVVLEVPAAEGRTAAGAR